jgi:hypothetical protein
LRMAPWVPAGCQPVNGAGTSSVVLLGGEAMRKLVLVLVAALAGGCALVPDGIEPGQTYVIGPVGGWTAEEKEALQGACDRWREWTDGRLLCRIGEEGEDADAEAVRGSYKGEDIAIDRWGRKVYIDVGAHSLDQASVELYAAHCIGLAAGMWKHDKTGHVLSPHTLEMKWGEEDRQACRDAGFCD